MTAPAITHQAVADLSFLMATALTLRVDVSHASTRTHAEAPESFILTVEDPSHRAALAIEIGIASRRTYRTLGGEQETIGGTWRGRDVVMRGAL